MTAKTETQGPEIIRLITEVKKSAGALAAVQTNGVPFPFRGIDGTVNHLAKHVEEAGIVVVPQVREHEVTERSPDGKRVVKTSKVLTDFTFYAPDGSSITATTTGLADDFADRSAAQAQSVAFRVALLQTFFLPTQSPEPEQTGQAVQEGSTVRPSATSHKLEQARAATAPDGDRVKEIQAKIREAIASGVVQKDVVNAEMTRLKSESGLSGVALQEALAKFAGVEV